MSICANARLNVKVVLLTKTTSAAPYSHDPHSFGGHNPLRVCFVVYKNKRPIAKRGKKSISIALGGTTIHQVYELSSGIHSNCCRITVLSFFSAFSGTAATRAHHRHE